MGEYFDVTLFLERERAEKENARDRILGLLMLDEGRNLPKRHQYPLLSDREVLLNTYEETDFLEYEISLSDFVITEKNLTEMLSQLLQVVDVCFGQIPSVLFATGIYELTYYYLDEEQIRSLRDFDKRVLLKFPFLFFRIGSEYGLTPSQRYGNTSYLVNLGDGVQDVFANPRR